MRSIWNMPVKRKKTWIFHQCSLPGVFSHQACLCFPILTLVGWSSPLQCRCSFPFSSRLGPHLCHQRDGPRRLQERRILLDRTALDFQDQGASPDASTTWAIGYAVCVCLSLARRTKRHCLFPCYMVARKPIGVGGIEANKIQMLVVWKKGMWKEEEWTDEGMWRITSSLPSRRPWMWLLCWSEWYRPKFFSLTTEACEFTSSPTTGGELLWQSLTVPSCSSSASLSHPVLPFVLVCAFSPCGAFILSFLLVYNTWWHYFLHFQKHPGEVQSRLAVKKLGTHSDFQGNPNWKPSGSGDATNKQEMCATAARFKMTACLHMKVQCLTTSTQPRNKRATSCYRYKISAPVLERWNLNDCFS